MTREQEKELEEKVRRSARSCRILLTVVAASLAILLMVGWLRKELDGSLLFLGEIIVIGVYLLVLGMIEDVPE